MRQMTTDWLLRQLIYHKARLLIGLALGLSLSLSIFALIPSKYKASARINVSSKYFQNPMMRDFLSETYDPGELRSEREATITSAMTADFLTKIIEKNPNNNTPEKKSAAIEGLKHSLEILRENSTTFQVAALSSNPQESYELCLELVHQIIETAKESRSQYLTQLRDSVRGRLMSIMGNGSSNSTSTMDIASLNQQLEKQKAQLLIDLKPNHPEVQALNKKIHALKSRKNLKDEKVVANLSDPSLKASAEVKNRLLEDLLRKYQMLEIVLNMEKNEDSNYINVIEEATLPTKPVAPKLPIFIAWGLLAGLIFGLILVAIKIKPEVQNMLNKKVGNKEPFQRSDIPKDFIDTDDKKDPSHPKEVNP